MVLNDGEEIENYYETAAPPIQRKLKTILKLVMHDGGEEIENDELADDTKEEENYSERCNYNV